MVKSNKKIGAHDFRLIKINSYLMIAQLIVVLYLIKIYSFNTIGFGFIALIIFVLCGFINLIIIKANHKTPTKFQLTTNSITAALSIVNLTMVLLVVLAQLLASLDIGIVIIASIVGQLYLGTIINSAYIAILFIILAGLTVISSVTARK